MSVPLTVLIVDDDPLQCWVWRKTLEKRYGDKVHVETFTDSREALSRISGDVALVLIDWLMPHLGGTEFLEKAREKGMGADRFVVFSGRDLSEIQEAFGPKGCLAFVEKGRVEQEESLLRVLDDVVSKKSQC